MPDVTPADLLAAYGGYPAYPDPSGGTVAPGDVLSALGGPWLARAQEAARRDAEAYQRGGVPELMANRQETAELAGGFGGVTRDPRLWHGISAVKLPKPVSEMTADIAQRPVVENVIRPEDLQGGWLLPTLGDRSAASGTLTGIGGRPLAAPVELQGGAGYMPANTERGAIWANAPGATGTIEGRAQYLTDVTGAPVYMPYTAMGKQAVDSSHHVSDALAAQMPSAEVTRSAKRLFNEEIERQGLERFPGVGSPNLADYLMAQTGDVRNTFAKTMDKAYFQNQGFPSVAETRFAVTDPRLLNEPTGASGLAISRVTPGAERPPSGHRTYPEATPGEYVGGFGTSVPKELMYPDVVKALEAYRSALPGYKPTIDYLMMRTPVGEPFAQKANQEWVDRLSQYLARNPPE